MKEKKGNFYVFLGALFWSLNAPIVSGVNMPPLFVSCFRSLIAFLVLMPFIKFDEVKKNLNPYLAVFLISYLGLCATITVAIKNTAAPIAIGMQYASILWIFAIDFFIMGRKEYSKIPAILLILSGVILFMTSNNAGGSKYGNFIAFTESIFFTLMTLSSKKLEGINPLALTSLGNLFTAVVLLIFIGDARYLIFSLKTHEYISLLLLGTVQVALGYGFYNMGLKYTTAQNASIIAILEMILGPLWVFLFLHQGSSRQTLIGFMFIIAGLIINYLISVSSKKVKVPEKVSENLN